VTPDDLDDFDWADAEVRGALLNVFLDHGGRVSAVTKKSVGLEGDRLARRGHLDWLLDLTAVPASEWSLVGPEYTDWTRTSGLDRIPGPVRAAPLS
jgi:hypothetical protein